MQPLLKVVTKDYMSRKDVCRSNNCNTGNFDLTNVGSRLSNNVADDYLNADEPMSTCIACRGDLEQDPDACWADSVELR